jgi:hypothetical protein
MASGRGKMSGSKHFLLAAAVDLVCCAFGGAILLFIISAAAVEEDESAQKDNFMIVRLLQQNHTGAELRILWKGPGEKAWQGKEEGENANAFSSPSAKGGGSAFAIIKNPKKGIWSFRGYYVDYPSTDLKEEPPETIETKVRFEVHSPYSKIYLPEPEILKRPSSTTSETEPLKIIVGT